LQVPLARVVIAGGVISGGMDYRVRSNARRLVTPHAAGGITEAGATNWMDASGLRAPNLWLQTDIDTSAAGFLNAPAYFAQLCRQGPARPHPRTGSLDQAAGPFGSLPAFSLDGLGAITRPTPQGFTFRIPRGTLPLGVDLTVREAEAGGWVVAWLGLEPVTGSEPLLNLQAILAALGTII